MPLPDDLAALLALQETDAKTLRAQTTLAALDTGGALAAAYNTEKTEAERLRAAAIKAQAEQHDAEMRLSSIETKAAQVQKTLFSGTVTGPRELENLQKETEMLARQRGEAETRVLEAMETAGEQVAEAEAAERALAATAEKYRIVRTAFKERHTALSGELGALASERAERVKSVPATLLARYEALRGKKSGVGAALLDASDSCGACHTRISSGLAEAARDARTVEVCEYCGRILVPAGFVKTAAG